MHFIHVSTSNASRRSIAHARVQVVQDGRRTSCSCAMRWKLLGDQDSEELRHATEATERCALLLGVEAPERCRAALQVAIRLREQAMALPLACKACHVGLATKAGSWKLLIRLVGR